MYIKGSGSDMKSIVPKEYPAVRLDYVLPLIEREAMSDEEMVAYLARCLIDPTSPRPSIETLLHAFLPWRAVLHTHTDAILALTNTRGREKTVRECFGDGMILVPYLRPGFELSRQVGLLAKKQPGADGLILMNHGLITWGDTPQEAYEKHIALVTKAENFVKGRAIAKAAGATVADVPASRREGLAVRFGPVLRGLLGREKPVILEYDDKPEVLDFLARPEAGQITQIGPATPDHLLYTKRYPLFVNLPLEASLEEQKGVIAQALDQYQANYKAHFEKHAPPEEKMLEPMPRVVLVPGLGMWTAGKDARAARIVHDIYRHTMTIVAGAEELGVFATLNDKDAYEAEYWPLELYKLTLLPKEKELARKVALVTGAASGIGRAIARRLAEEGAHVVVTDLDEAGAEAVAEEINKKQGLRRAIALSLDVTKAEDVARSIAVTCQTYGGLDIVVSNAGIAQVGAIDKLELRDWERSLAVNTTGHFLVVRAALEVMKTQGTGGSIVFNATKNVTAPGKDFGAYSVAKAAEAQLCRIVAIEAGEYGIRANMLNPDAIFEGSQLWSEELKRQRAQAYGLKVAELPDFYRQRNLLKAEVSGEDVAEAALFLAGPRSAKTTGAMLPVDGGVREAFPR
jgi:rhamnulose-1-phosphate aldolase/alcohol dehydrogenase